MGTITTPVRVPRRLTPSVRTGLRAGCPQCLIETEKA